MSTEPTELAEITEYGPAMKGLRPKLRAFVLAYCTNGCNATEAAREAGYNDTGTGAIKVIAHRHLQRLDVLAAIREWTLARTRANLPVYMNLIERIADTPGHKDEFKAALALANRGGMAEVQKHEHEHVHVLTYAEKLARIKEIAAKNNAPLEFFLGETVEGEFSEVKPFEFDPEAY